MLISTKGRYALRVLIDMAEHNGNEYIKLKDIAERQEISEKYLESIVKQLVNHHIVVGLRGKGGGYRLTREPDEYTLNDILRAAEGDIAPISCLEKGARPCERAGDCRTLPMWKELNTLITDYLNSKTLADLMKKS